MAVFSHRGLSDKIFKLGFQEGVQLSLFFYQTRAVCFDHFYKWGFYCAPRHADFFIYAP